MEGETSLIQSVDIDTYREKSTLDFLGAIFFDFSWGWVVELGLLYRSRIGIKCSWGKETRCYLCRKKMKDYMIFGSYKGNVWLVFIAFWFISFYPQDATAQFDAQIAELQQIDRANLELLHSVSFPVSLKQPHDLYIYSEWISGWLSLKDNDELIPLMTRFNILTGGVELKSRKQVRMLQVDRVDMVLMGPRFFRC